MNTFRVIAIIISIAFIIMACLSFGGILPKALHGVMIVLGIISAVFNVISTVAWWMVDKENQWNSKQLRWYRFLS